MTPERREARSLCLGRQEALEDPERDDDEGERTPEVEVREVRLNERQASGDLVRLACPAAFGESKHRRRPVEADDLPAVGGQGDRNPSRPAADVEDRSAFPAGAARKNSMSPSTGDPAIWSAVTAS